MNWEIRIYSGAVELSIAAQMADETFGDFVKGVVDVEREILGLGGELHSDIEEMLLSQGSIQQHLWGINLHPSENWPDIVEFDSLINIRPRQNNRSRYVEDAILRERIIDLLDGMLVR
ncbi:MAG: DUF5674 family protein [Pyrinomonadaceae bacterium]